MREKQVRNRSRVAAHGEVFTAQREVQAMCDLVDTETRRIESRFLEPACGNGNFLAEILARKLGVVQGRYHRSPADYEKYAVLAISSLYGVELLADNVAECRQRLFGLWDAAYTANNRRQAREVCREAARFILQKNILCGDALTLLQADGSPILFAEWSLVTGCLFKRRDFALSELLESRTEHLTLDTMCWGCEDIAQPALPTPVREYPLIEYWRVQEYA